MKLREALETYLVESGVRSTKTPTGQLYDNDWFVFYVGGKRLRLFRMSEKLRGIVALHDAHHLLTGYGTAMRGEAEIAAWELASGGCGKSWLMWSDRISVLFLVAPFYPRAFARAFRRGFRRRNLYRLDPEATLERDLDEVKSWLAIDPSAAHA
ncbi:MAG: hypothetical protein VCB78_07095 [Myxococcota bacterium]